MWEELGENAVVHRQWEICWVYTCADSPTFIERNRSGAQWTELQKHWPCHSVTCRNNEVTAEWWKNYTPYGGLSFGAKQVGKGRENGYSWGGD